MIIAVLIVRLPLLEHLSTKFPFAHLPCTLFSTVLFSCLCSFLLYLKRKSQGLVLFFSFTLLSWAPIAIILICSLLIAKWTWIFHYFFLVYLSLYIFLTFVLLISCCLSISDSPYYFMLLFYRGHVFFYHIKNVKKIFKGGFPVSWYFRSSVISFLTVLSTVLKMDFFHQISWKLPQLPTIICNDIPISHPLYITIINFKVSLLFYKVEPSPGIHIISPLIFSETCITDDASSLLHSKNSRCLQPTSLTVDASLLSPSQAFQKHCLSSQSAFNQLHM